jgi:signal transduction histidine kinase
VPVELDLDLGSPPGQQAEAAAYYTASEALANTAKHAQASVIDLRVQGDDSALTLSIRDDGIGGADPSRGTGIIGLKDRVEALGGTISVLSPPGRGTTLHVRLPAGPSAAARADGSRPEDTVTAAAGYGPAGTTERSLAIASGKAGR